MFIKNILNIIFIQIEKSRIKKSIFSQIRYHKNKLIFFIFFNLKVVNLIQVFLMIK